MRTKEHHIALKNVGKLNPESIEDYISAGGYDGIRQAVRREPKEIVGSIVDSGLLGRGGGGFSAGLKEQFTSEACISCDERFVVCNADEGEPGTFKDRIIMENDPHRYIEGMLIAGWAIMATRGFIYLRAEYTTAIERTYKALQTVRDAGLLGDNILDTGWSFDIELRKGAGSYLCGEELTMLESLEGKRGYPRIKPPFPAEKGLWGMPTLINNVETFAHMPAIICNGTEWYRSLGVGNSTGTKLFTISGNVNSPGCYEAEMGVTLRQLLEEYADGMKPGKSFKAALLGGAAGTFVDHSMLDFGMGFDTLKEHGATLGSGAVIVIDEDQSIREILYNILRFFAHESCGKCIPCRVGTSQLLVQMDRVGVSENGNDEALSGLARQAEVMARTSLCPLGQSPILPIRSALKYFRSELDGKQG